MQPRTIILRLIRPKQGGLCRVAMRDGAEILGEVDRPKPPAVLLARWLALLSESIRIHLFHGDFLDLLCRIYFIPRRRACLIFFVLGAGMRLSGFLFVNSGLRAWLRLHARKVLQGHLLCSERHSLSVVCTDV